MVMVMLASLKCLLSCGRRLRGNQLMVVEAHKEALVRMTPDHVPEEMLLVLAEVVVLIVAVVDLPESVHVHLTHKRDGLLRVKLIVWRLQVVGLKFVPVQVNSLAVLRPA